MEKLNKSNICNLLQFCVNLPFNFITSINHFLFLWNVTNDKVFKCEKRAIINSVERNKQNAQLN